MNDSKKMTVLGRDVAGNMNQPKFKIVINPAKIAAFIRDILIIIALLKFMI